MRQPVTIDIQSFESIVFDLAKYLESEKYENILTLTKHLKKYHTICLDQKKIWLEYFNNMLSDLDVYKYEYGVPIKKMINDKFVEYLKTFNISIDIKNIAIEKICLEIAEKSISKILVSDKRIENKIIKNYNFEDFNELNDKSSVLLRDKKICSFNPGEDILHFEFLKPYLMFAKKIKICDKYLFQNPEDYQIISSLVNKIIDLDGLVIEIEFNDFRKNRNVKSNLNELKILYPHARITKEYKSHKREITTEYSKIVIDHSLNNIGIKTNGDYLAKDYMTFTATLIN